MQNKQEKECLETLDYIKISMEKFNISSKDPLLGINTSAQNVACYCIAKVASGTVIITF